MCWGCHDAALWSAGDRPPDLPVAHHPGTQHRAQQLEDRLVTDAFLHCAYQTLMRNRLEKQLAMSVSTTHRLPRQDSSTSTCRASCVARRGRNPNELSFSEVGCTSARVAGRVCRHVLKMTGRTNSNHALTRLFENNIFTVHRGHHGWYSYQPLLRHLLTNLPDPTHPVDPSPATRWTATNDRTRIRRDGPTLIPRQLTEDTTTIGPGPSDSEVRAVEELIRRLVGRFPDVPADSVRQIVNASWDEFTDTPIRDFLPVLVERAAQEQLRNATA